MEQTNKGLTKTLTYNCPECGSPITFDYFVPNKDILWPIYKGEHIFFQESKCGRCGSEYVLPVKIDTRLIVEIDGYMPKAEYNEMFQTD